MRVTGYILLSVYFAFSIIVQFRIIDSKLVNKKQKIFNSILLWIIPLLWGIIILNFLQSSKLDVMTREKRKMKKFKFTDNWENLTGLGGNNEHQL